MTGRRYREISDSFRFRDVSRDAVTDLCNFGAKTRDLYDDDNCGANFLQIIDSCLIFYVDVDGLL